MSSIDIGFIVIAALIVLVFIGVHVGFSLILTGFVGFALIGGLAPAFANMAIVPFATTNNYNFALIPLFLLMSSFVARGGIGEEAYKTARAWVGQIRGGLAMATVGG